MKAHGLVLRELRRGADGLTLPQFDVLAQLERRPEGMTAGQITRALLVTAGNVTGIVHRLAAAGFVERHPVPGDRRAVRVALTPRGRRVAATHVAAHRRRLAAIFARVPARDLARLRTLLRRLNASLEGNAP